MLRLLAQQATARAERHANVLPMLATMAASAAVTEIELCAGEGAAVWAALGLPARECRQVARGLPAVAGHVAQTVVRGERWCAHALTFVADVAADVTSRAADTATDDDLQPSTGSSPAGS